ncbi:MAG: 2-succinyl-5-enolpyruvyl-6-hydroxy-3-cyclohexene-1-carboxylic-acid synthase [Anaerolineae bacterium]
MNWQRCGMRHVVVCPGSRSTPLALMFARRYAEQQDIRLWMHVDERSAAFFALGMAKYSGQAVALVCTSGTAVANFMPAVVEAHYARVPLLVLTADRPPELREIGAPQTIDQGRLYGAHAKWYAELPIPEASADMLRYVRATANRAVAEAVGSPAGPVHLNFPFREPLVPLPSDDPIFEPRADFQPYTQTTSGSRSLNFEQINQIAEIVTSNAEGIIVCGAEYRHDPQFASAVVALAGKLGFPILADPLSNVRCGTHPRDQVIDAYDAFLRDPAIVDHLKPELVIRFGAMPTSKPLLQFLQKHSNAAHIVVDGGGAWNDPALRATHMIHADSRSFCEALIALPTISSLSAQERNKYWLSLWQDIDQRTRRAIELKLDNFEEPFEGTVFATLSGLLPDNTVVFASSSMPVRDLDTFFDSRKQNIRFLANRGANGIDGVVSTALGVSAVSEIPVVLVIGDLALYHDMNGLLAANLHKLNLVIIVINNDGGGIFSFLPQAAHPEHFERLFGTPHGLDFAHVAALYSADYQQPKDWQHFRNAVTHCLGASAGDKNTKSTGLNIIEVRTNRETNVSLHRQVWAAVSGEFAKVSESSNPTS